MIVTSNEIFFVWELNFKICGLTLIAVFFGGLTTSLYIELLSPTLVTVLLTVIEFLRFGIDIEGRFKSNLEGTS